MDFLEFSDVSCEIRGKMVSGGLQLTDEKVKFRAKNKQEEIKKSELEMVNWQRLAGSWGLRVFTKDGDLYRFAGFKEAERERLAKFFKSTYKLDMLDRELSVKGWNWGTAKFHGGVLGFEVGKSDAFELPLKYVNQCVAAKNECSLEFHANDDASVMLTEMRFHIPSSELAGEDPVEDFKENVLKNASVITSSGDAVANFTDVYCLAPRGRYDIKVFPSIIHLHGKTFDYKIQVQSVQRLFLLPQNDKRHTHFVINVDPPVKQGQTRYHFLVFRFDFEKEVDLTLPFTEEELNAKFDGKLQKEMQGPAYEVISNVMRAICGRKITQPGKFLGHSGTPAITCSYKAASGFFYPLEKGLIFIYRPPIYVRFDEIRVVNFERSGGSTRSFDINVTTHNDISHTFSSIQKEEYGKLYDYLKAKNIKIKTAGKGDAKSGLNFNEESVDHRLAMVKADAEEFDSGENSLSSDDSDFNPDALEALSAKEEYDSDPSTTSDEGSDGGATGSDAERRREERRQKKEAKREKRQQQKPGEKTERKKKKVKLPGQPKRNMTAYFWWMNENREKIKADHPDLSLADFGKKAGELWKALEDKSEWETKAAEDKKRYDEEMTKWKAEGGAQALAAAKKEAKKQKRKSTASAKATPTKVDPKGGSGSGFKSKEFIEDSDSSSDDGGKKKKSTKGSAKKDEDDVEMKSSSAASASPVSATDSD